MKDPDGCYCENGKKYCADFWDFWITPEGLSQFPQRACDPCRCTDVIVQSPSRLAPFLTSFSDECILKLTQNMSSTHQVAGTRPPHSRLHVRGSSSSHGRPHMQPVTWEVSRGRPQMPAIIEEVSHLVCDMACVTCSLSHGRYHVAGSDASYHRGGLASSV
jgi:hypothetical protein